jgi:molybdopterin synthase sulfurtransferase
VTDQIYDISTDELHKKLDDPGTKIIDVRTSDAYNGWRERNEPRGGHIKSARSLPLKWTNYIDWIEMVRLKQIFPEHEIIVYGYDRDSADIVADRFLRSGYSRISVYYHFTTEWSASPDLPMEFLERYRHLVSPQWIKSLISGGAPMHYDNNRYVILHAHYRNRDAYLSGHIPGAIDMDTLTVESHETWNRRSPLELKSTLEQHGITSETTVIIYGKFMDPDNNDPFPGSSAGDIGALRCAFILMYAGVTDVRVLNGGFQSWTDSGFEVSYKDEPKNPVNDFGITIPLMPHLAVDTPQAKLMLESPGSELVCVRSLAEYKGEVSGYNYIEQKGRIPGAIFADCGSDAYHMENYRNFDHTIREFHEVAGNWQKNGITPDKHLAFYCGTGWRGSEGWFNAWLMGWPRVSVYDGGWFEWSRDPANPYESGESGNTGSNIVPETRLSS